MTDSGAIEIDTNEAIQRAVNDDLDLVCVAPSATPPVCKIMNYSKFMYDQKKREKEQRAKQAKQPELKEVRMNYNIGQHDIEIKLKNVKRLISEGDNVKVAVRFKGRERMYTSKGIEMLQNMAEQLTDCCTIQEKPKVMGQSTYMVVVPIKK